MRYEYNKLVRDYIPEEINKEKGRSCKWRILNEEEYIKELNKKLFEEANEFIEDYSVEELGDLMEVILAIMNVKNISKEDVETARIKKREKKGSFKNKIYLIDVEEEEKNVE